MLFKKRKKSDANGEQTVSDALTMYFISVQIKCAEFMSRKTNHWQKKQKLTFFIVVAILMGGTSTFFLINSLFIHYGHQFQIPQSLPSPPLLPEPREDAELTLSRADTLLFLQVRKSIDSMNSTPEGRKQMQEFMAAHPGFLDSLAYAEKILSLP